MKILVVEDEPEIVETLRMLLECSGFEVKSAVDGKEGVEMFFNELASGAPFDLVLTDYRMPEKNGAQVIAEILEAVPKQPIVLMTAYELDLDPIRDLSDKKIPIIQKPFELEKFNAVIQRYSKSGA